MTCKDCRKIRYCMERHRGICTSFKGGERREKTGGNSGKEEKSSKRAGKTARYIRQGC